MCIKWLYYKFGITFAFLEIKYKKGDFNYAYFEVGFARRGNGIC